jgi:GTPase SAR1 family protein
MICRYCEDSFNKNYKKTVGVDFFQKRIELNEDTNVSLQLWDIDGTAISGKMLDTYVHDANAIVYVFDITSQESFQALEYWMSEVALQTKIPAGSEKEPPIKVIFGNKSDLNHQVKVDSEMI